MYSNFLLALGWLGLAFVSYSHSHILTYKVGLLLFCAVAFALMGLSHLRVKKCV